MGHMDIGESELWEKSFFLIKQERYDRPRNERGVSGRRSGAGGVRGERKETFVRVRVWDDGPQGRRAGERVIELK